MTARFIAAATLVLLAACNKQKEPDPAATSAKPASTSAPASAKPADPTSPPDVTWDAPSIFEKLDFTNAMRKATYKLKRADGDPEDAELTVTQVGGGVDANVLRWQQQFDKQQKSSRDEKTVNGLRMTVVQIQGTYKGMAMPGQKPAEKERWALLGAIVETATPTFFKLTGPEKTVLAAKPDFDKLVASIKPR